MTAFSAAKDRVRPWLFDQALPLWAERGVDAQGRFFEQLDFDGRPVKEYLAADGDFGPIGMIAVAYGYAVRQRLNLSIDPDSEDAYTGAICLAGGYAKDSFTLTAATQTRLQLSPGDLDEAIRALLDLAGQRDFTCATETNGFARVSAFRKGFDDVKSCR